MSTTFISWKADPDFRGTFNILSSCLGTLLICLWSAVHDDVTKGMRWYQRTISKIGWVVIGLFVPELLLFITYNQHLAARDLMEEANQSLPGMPPPPASSSCWRNMGRFISLKHHRSQEPPEDRVPLQDTHDSGPSAENGMQAGSTSLSAPSGNASLSSHGGSHRHRWTLTHAFFVAMGGFKLDGHGDEGNRYIPAWQGEAIITPNGLKYLMKHAPHLIPDISIEEIQDKSKANGLAKALLVWQVLWFCINTVTRASHLE
ncbi:hypothetical protein DAEQUDRAFT_719138 [Daedalea quercina L-15889]|uniref:Uncharacterized protein n=1 Tax=Daedalea quercina L-15889 TaxID=1314783 RepID=A0A165KWA0_9APHY|nr:hypothetical protein DAEQUDRAFT_719138 [Daedalea quercina L-15889]